MKAPSEYLKMQVLGMIDHMPGVSIRERIKAVSELTFTDEEGNQRTFTWRTIETWRNRYQKYGLTALQRTKRSDKGRSRNVSPEKVAEAVEQVLPTFHKTKRPTKMAIYRACIEAGLLRRDEIAPNTFSRMVNQYDLLKPASESTSRQRKAFAKAHANELWQVDTMFGPYLNQGGRKVPAKLIAFIDDASRLCVHGAFSISENTAALVDAFKMAFYKRGVPEALYADNGSIYTSKEIVLICARVGCLLNHAPLRDGAAKGKVERFFRTVRDQFLCRQLDLSSLESLNLAFGAWVEAEYNAREHSSLGMSPSDRFGLDRNRVKFLGANESSDELFYMEEDRLMKKDNTFSFKSVRYESPSYLPSCTVQIRYDRTQPTDRVIVYYKGERQGVAYPVDFQANDRKKRGGKS